MQRCPWAGSHPLLSRYHDLEWGVPVFNDRLLFEFLVLEGMQSGLSWLTILKKRNAFREAMDHFDPEIIARYNDQKLAALMHNSDIIRNRMKIKSTVINAQAVLALREKGLSFHDFIWQFTDGLTIDTNRDTSTSVPAQTKESREMSRTLKQAGFSFVGPVVCYSFMQAVGLVNDHLTDCFRHDEIEHIRRR